MAQHTSALLLCLAALLPALASSATTQYLVTFGDSYTQTGFDLTSAATPSPQNPLGNPSFPGWTTSGGTNWVGALVSAHNASALLSYNLASGGATTDAALVAPYDPATVRSFADQVAQFEAYQDAGAAPWHADGDDDLLVGVWMGVNDVGNAYYLANATAVVDAVVARYFALLQQLYDAGARNFFLLTVPPIYEAPANLQYTDDARALEKSVIARYNGLLERGLADFVAANGAATAALVDTTAAFQTVIDDPQAYGAANATCYAADGTSCVWYNDYHPGIAIHGLVAQAVADAVGGGFFV